MTRRHLPLRAVRRGARLAARASDVLEGLFWRVPLGPRRRWCPVCGLRTRRFSPGGTARRQDTRCPRCQSLERHRALYLYLNAYPCHGPAPRVLVIAPDRGLDRWAGAVASDYLSIDLDPRVAMRRMDLTALELPDEDRDVIVAYHVLEHIPDDLAAMREIARVLTRDGCALLEVPLAVDPSAPTDERFIAGPARDRVRHYGQADHVRLYGRTDLLRRLAESGLVPEVVRVGTVLHEDVDAARLQPDELFFVCRRAAVP